MVQAASSLAEAESILAEWHPHVSVIDMEHEDAPALLQRLGASNTMTPSKTVKDVSREHVATWSNS